nr:SWIM zinc finger family protein [Natronoarchaeum rubrum]
MIKRAQYEAFEFTIDGDGVLVRNTSHANPDEHEYVVSIENGLPTECECPANASYDGACKHRVAVAIRRPIPTAAVDRQLAADGGPSLSADQPQGTDELGERSRETPSEDSAVESSQASENEQVDDDEACAECEKLSTDFPCWECVRTGRRSLPSGDV